MSKKKILLIVIADDFSGASEIGGIGQRYGLDAEVQLKFDAESSADLIVIDTNTRSLNRAEALRKTKELVNDLKKCGRPFRLFKKVDSVMRGHIVGEINVLQQHFHFNKILVMPANPDKGRKIINGQYLVNGEPLDQTVFAKDPDFPIRSSFVEDILNAEKSLLPHVHLSPNHSPPVDSLITGEVGSRPDLKKYINIVSENDLCCGAGECFEAFLENLGYSAQTKMKEESGLGNIPYTLIINGSTVRSPEEEVLLSRLQIPRTSLPGNWSGNAFRLSKEAESNWHREVSALLHTHRVLSIRIDHPVKSIKGPSELFSAYFVKLIHYITDKINRKDIRLCLTGGATSSAIIRKLGLERLKVKEEVAPGVVTLTGGNDAPGAITIKPGSYLWAESVYQGTRGKE